MIRFFVLALPLGLLLFASAHMAQQWAGYGIETSLPPNYLIGRWLLEAVGLAVLFSMFRERGLTRVGTGLVASWTAWIFRAPVLMLTVRGHMEAPVHGWWSQLAIWLCVYTAFGLLLAGLAPRHEVENG